MYDGGPSGAALRFDGGDAGLGLDWRPSAEPLSCAPPARVLGPDTLALLLNLHTPQNLFHQHNDNLLPLALAAMQGGWRPTLQGGAGAAGGNASSAGGGAGGAPRPTRLVLLVGPLSPTGWREHAFLGYVAGLAFDEVIDVRPAGAGVQALCLSTARLGRPLKAYWTSWRSLAQYAAEGAARAWADHVLARAGLPTAGTLPPLPPRSWPPSVLFVRRRTSRTLAAEDETLLRTAFAEVGVAMVGAEMEGMAPAEQLRTVAAADVLVGVHGAGLTHALYMRPGSLLLQLCPTHLDYWEAALFQRLALLGGLSYYEWREGDFDGAPRFALGQGTVRIRWPGRPRGSMPEHVRVLVMHALLQWARDAGASDALAGGGGGGARLLGQAHDALLMRGGGNGTNPALSPH